MATLAEITAAYQSQLGREPDADGLAYWTAQGNMDGFASGVANEKAINGVYHSSFGRPADQSGFDYWTKQAAGNADFDYNKAISSGAQGSDIAARDDIAAGGVDTSATWGGGASLTDPNLRYDSVNNTWGTSQPLTNQDGGAKVENYGRNPYLSQMATDIQRRAGETMNLGLQNIRGNAVGVGGLGGSRQGVAEGAALSGANDALQGNLANLFGGDYTQSQNRDLQRYGVDVNANLTRGSQGLQRYGMDQNAYLTRRGQDQSFTTANRGLDNQQRGMDQNAWLTNQGQTQNFYSTQRGQDLQQLGLGAQLFGQGNAGYLSQGQGIYGLGNTQQQAPWNVINSANGGISPYTGYGATNTASGSSGGGASGMAGGALAGAQIGKNLGLGGGWTPASGGNTNWASGSGWGTGNGWGNQDYGSYL